MENKALIDHSACIVSGSEADLRRQLAAAAKAYSAANEYFAYLQAKTEDGFRESASAFLLLDALLQKHDIDRSSLSLVLLENGRPAALDWGLDFSISHDNGAAICCIAIGEDACVGADIRCAREYSAIAMGELASGFLTTEQLSLIASADDEERERLFYTLWTRREAYIKSRNNDIPDNADYIDLEGDGFSTAVIHSCGTKYYYSIYSA